MRERIGAITGASSDAIIALLLQREPALPPRRLAELNRWQAFATIWRQEWEPAARESRGQRIAAYVITVVVHLLWAILLIWLTYARLAGIPARQGEDIVRVTYIGKGTPQDEGGGAPSGEVAEPMATAPAKSAPQAERATAPTRAALTQVPPLSQPRLQQPQPAPPKPAPPSPQQAQPLEVTQTNQPDSSFVLAPTTPRTVSVPQPRIVVPELDQSAEALRAVELPTPAPIERALPEFPTARITVPDIQTPTESLPQPNLKAVRPRQVEIAQAQIQAPALNAAIADLPMPETRTAEAGQSAADDGASKSAAATFEKGTAGNLPGATAAAAGGPPAAASGTGTNPATAGAGPKPAAKPGAWSTPQVGLDWGLSDRNQPGGQAGKPGLFDKNGRPRLPPGTSAAAGAGLPPGTIEQNIDHLDRAGTWLKRPPIDYTPTRFDRFWVPGGTLLEEWVRRGIKQLSIPIPGTSKKLLCVVSVLQLGGGCGITDPNMQDQEATARPPPDIPFKPELQEDQGALRQPVTSP